MGSTNLNKDLVDSYYMMLKGLSQNNKLELIARLSESMKTVKKNKVDMSWEDLFGAWELDQPTDEFLEDLKQSRNFSRNREEI